MSAAACAARRVCCAPQRALGARVPTRRGPAAPPPPPGPTEELQRLEQAFDTVKKQLLGRMHDIVRQQLQLPTADEGGGSGRGSPDAAAAAPPQRLLGPGAPHMELGNGGSGSSSSTSSSRSERGQSPVAGALGGGEVPRPPR